MNWVSPIRSMATIEALEKTLKQEDIRYYFLFAIGVSNGMHVSEILQLTVGDVRGKAVLEVPIGRNGVRQVQPFGEELQTEIEAYTRDRAEDELFITSEDPDFEKTAKTAIKRIGLKSGITSFGFQTVRKTFAYFYYQQYHDVEYLKKHLNYASDSLVYRYIGEQPVSANRTLTARENEAARRKLLTDKAGTERIRSIREFLEGLDRQIGDPVNSDAFYGSVECLLDELEKTVKRYECCDASETM